MRGFILHQLYTWQHLLSAHSLASNNTSKFSVLWPDVCFYQLCLHKGAGLVKNSEHAKYSQFLLEPKCSRFEVLGLSSSSSRKNTQKKSAAYDLDLGLEDLLLVLVQISCVMMDKSLTLQCLNVCI